jgi:hypothetical protein
VRKERAPIVFCYESDGNRNPGMADSLMFPGLDNSNESDHRYSNSDGDDGVFSWRCCGSPSVLDDDDDVDAWACVMLFPCEYNRPHPCRSSSALLVPFLSLMDKFRFLTVVLLLCRPDGAFDMLGLCFSILATSLIRNRGRGILYSLRGLGKHKMA